MQSFIESDRLNAADRVLSSFPDSAKNDPGFAAHAAVLHSRLGRHGQAIDALAAFPPKIATDYLALFLTEYLKARSLHLFFGLYNEIVRSGPVPPKIEVLYRKAFQLPIGRGSPVERRLFPHGRARRLPRLIFEQKWPGLAPDLRGALGGLKNFKGPNLLNPSVFDLLCEVNGIGRDEQAAFRQKVMQGCLGNILYRDVGLVSDRKDFSDGIDEVDRDEFAAALDELRQAGRSVLLVGAHVGLLQLGASAVGRTVGKERVNIGAGTAKATRETFVSVRNGPERALYVLARSLRKPGMVGAIAGDGTWGDSTYRARFLGREIKLGLGAPLVIFHTKCQPVWHTTGWKGEGLRTSFELGPTPHPGEPYDAWVPRWFEFYVAKLEEVAKGDPRNLRGRTGIWMLVSQSFGQEAPAQRRARPEAGPAALAGD